MKMTLVNKSHSKKWIGVLMASLLTASLLTGCGGDKKPAPAAGGAQPAATAAAAPEVKVEPALTGKIGSVNFSSQKLAGASFMAKSTQRGYMLRYKGDLVYGNAETKTWTALKVDSPKAAVDKSLFTDGVLKGDEDFHRGWLTADSSGKLYRTASAFTYPFENGKFASTKIFTKANGNFIVAPDGKTGYEFGLKNLDMYKLKGNEVVTSSKLTHPFNFGITGMTIAPDGKLYVVGNTNTANDMKNKWMVMSADGQQLGLYGSEDKKAPDYLKGIFNSIAVTDKYVAIIDSLGSLYLWGKDGKFMGQAKEEALFGKGHTNNEIVNWDGNSIMAWNYNQKSDSNNKVQFDFYLITF